MSITVIVHDTLKLSTRHKVFDHKLKTLSYTGVTLYLYLTITMLYSFVLPRQCSRTIEILTKHISYIDSF